MKTANPLSEELTNGDVYRLHWQMSNCEKFAIQDLLGRLQVDAAIEVGTYRGGSLQVLSRFARHVTSIDVDPGVANELEGKFQNVSFVTGDSSLMLLKVLGDYDARGERVGFILIDGDHTANGVRRDIEALLSWKPQSRCVVLLHDSFNPGCRDGIKTAEWVKSPYVHFVEIDFVPGIYHEHAYDTAEPRSMWGGFACAVMEPHERKFPLVITCSQQGLFDAVFKVSRYNDHVGLGSKFKSLLRRLGAAR